MFLKLLSLVALSCWLVPTADSVQQQKRLPHVLRDQIFANYSKLVRPVLNQSENVVVFCQIHLKQILTVDVNLQQVQLAMVFRQFWVDEGLRWDPRQFRTRFIRLSHNDIWLPDIILINSIGSAEHIKEISVLPIRVQYAGAILWNLPMTKTVQCFMDVTYFPFDIQKCTLLLGSFTHFMHAVDVRFNPDIRETSETRDHLEWYLAGSRRERMTQEFYGIVVPTLSFEYVFARYPSFYVFTMILPTYMVCLMCLFAFTMPNECGEKIAFSITILLSLVVNLMVMRMYIPPSSESFPLLGIFFLVCICVVGAAVLVSQLVLLINSCSLDPVPVPPALRCFVFGPLARLTLTDTSGIDPDGGGGAQSDHCSAETNVDRAAAVQHDPGCSGHHHSDSQTALILMSIIYRFEKSASYFLRAARTEETRARIEVEWSVLANIFDRCIMALFLALCLLFSAVFFALIYFGHQHELRQHHLKH